MKQLLMNSEPDCRYCKNQKTETNKSEIKCEMMKNRPLNVEAFEARQTDGEKKIQFYKSVSVND